MSHIRWDSIRLTSELSKMPLTDIGQPFHDCFQEKLVFSTFLFVHSFPAVEQRSTLRMQSDCYSYLKKNVQYQSVQFYKIHLFY